MIPKGTVNSVVIYTASTVVSSAIPFLLLPIFTRVLSPADYGTVAMFTIVVSILSIFSGLSVQGAIMIRYYEQDKINLPIYVTSSLFVVLMSTIIVVTGVFVFRAWLEKFTSVPSEWLVVAALVAGMQTLVLVRLSLWQSAKRSLLYGILQVGQVAINASLSLWFVLVVDLAWVGRTLGIAIAAALVALMALISLWRGGWLPLKIDFGYVKNALKFGVPLIPHDLGGLLIAAVDRVMVVNLLGVAQAGIYTVALQVGMILSLLTIAVNQAYAPWLFEHLKRQDRSQDIQIVRYTYIYFLILLCIAILVGTLAPALFSVLAGEAYQAGADNVIYIAVGFAFGGMYFMVTNYVFLAGATGKLALNTLFAGLVNVALTYLLIKENGIAGAGQGFMISQAILFLGTWRLAHYVHPMPWKKALSIPAN